MGTSAGQLMPGGSRSYWLVHMMDSKTYQLSEKETAILIEAINRQHRGLIIFKKCVIGISSISSMEQKVELISNMPLLPGPTREQQIENKKKVDEALKKLGKGNNEPNKSV